MATIFGLHNLEAGSPGETATPMHRFIAAVLAQHPIELGLQLLSDGTGEVVGLFAGPLQQAWDEAIQALHAYIARSIPKEFNLCLAEADPYDLNLLGFFKTLPALVAVMPPHGHGLILIRGTAGLGHHHADGFLS